MHYQKISCFFTFNFWMLLFCSLWFGLTKTKLNYLESLLGLPMIISNIKIRALALCGILSTIIYFIAVAIGGFLDPAYSHIGKTVSELVQMGAPNRDLINIILVVYNLLIIPFAFGLYFGLKKGITRILVLVALILTGILGTIVTVFFPLDANGASVTFTGMMHLVVVGLVVPCTFVFMLGFWNSVRRWTLGEAWNVFSCSIRSDADFGDSDGCVCKL